MLNCATWFDDHSGILIGAGRTRHSDWHSDCYTSVVSLKKGRHRLNINIFGKNKK